MIVRSFHIELEDVKKALLKMGEEVNQALNELSGGMGDYDTLQKIIKNDEKINQLELELHERVTLLITKQQPVATDLRKLIAVLKISSDLERVADLAVDIAKQSKRLTANSFVQFENELMTIFKLAQKMMNESLVAFKQSDLSIVHNISQKDDEVDKLYGTFIKELFRVGQNELEVDQITQLVFIGRFIERIADYATNIAEWVVYEVDGQHLDLN